MVEPGDRRAMEFVHAALASNNCYNAQGFDAIHGRGRRQQSHSQLTLLGPLFVVPGSNYK